MTLLLFFIHMKLISDQHVLNLSLCSPHFLGSINKLEHIHEHLLPKLTSTEMASPCTETNEIDNYSTVKCVFR